MSNYTERKGFAEEVFDNTLDPAIDWIKYNLYPEDVFHEDSLRVWAEENGYAQSDE